MTIRDWGIYLFITEYILVQLLTYVQISSTTRQSSQLTPTRRTVVILIGQLSDESWAAGTGELVARALRIHAAVRVRDQIAGSLTLAHIDRCKYRIITKFLGSIGRSWPFSFSLILRVLGSGILIV